MSDNSVNFETVSLGDWILTMILSSIPIVGIIMVFVWAFGGGAKPSKKNFARALIIMTLIGIVLSVISSIVFAGAFAAIAENISSSYSY